MNLDVTCLDPTFFEWAATLVQEEICEFERKGSREENGVYRLKTETRSLFLKIGPDLAREYARLQWLQGRVPAPQPLAFRSWNNHDAFLMMAVAGESLAAQCAARPPKKIVERLAAALKTLHATPVTDWPFGGSGRVLVHGDACLPNILSDGDGVSGYIDVGDLALGEPETDLAAGVWSLHHNLGPGHGLALLQAYGLPDANEEDVERLRREYQD